MLLGLPCQALLVFEIVSRAQAAEGVEVCFGEAAAIGEERRRYGLVVNCACTVRVDHRRL